MEKKKKNLEKGITLIALIITIILLLILAGISIRAITNSDLLDKAKETSEVTSMKKSDEEIKLILNEWNIEKISNNISLEDFLNKKLIENKIDDFSVQDNGIEIILNGYGIIVDYNGKIIREIQKVEPTPVIKNLKITSMDEKDIEDYSQADGTQLKITFDTVISGGEILSVKPELPYITDGTERDVVFKITSIVNGVEYVKEQKISVLSKYEVIYKEDGILSFIEKNNFSTGKYKCEINGELYNFHIYSYDNDLNITENTLYGDDDDIGTATSYANNMVVIKVKGNLNISENAMIAPYSTIYGGPKGFLVYCTGTINNEGTIDNSHGAYANGQNVYLWKNQDNSYEYVPAQGASGGVDPGRERVGNNGATGTNRKTAGGGSGYHGTTYHSAGAGGNGTSYSGGTGGGATSGAASGTNGSSIGGVGGNNLSVADVGGGVGNPGGRNNSYSAPSGTGGLLIIYANNIQNLGTISANGTRASTSWLWAGGSSGGGSINVFYKSSYVNSGTITANGGQRGGSQNWGGAGGTGSISVGQIVEGSYQALTDETNY